MTSSRRKRKGRGSPMLAMVPYLPPKPSRKKIISRTPSSRLWKDVSPIKELAALYNASSNKLTSDKMAVELVHNLITKMNIVDIYIPEKSRKETYCSYKNHVLFEIIATCIHKTVYNIADIIFSFYMADIKRLIRNKGVFMNEMFSEDITKCIDTRIPAKYFNNLLEKLIYYGSYSHISHAIEGDSAQLEHLFRLIDIMYEHGAICSNPAQFINPVVTPACAAIYNRIVTNNNTYSLKQLLEKAIL